MNKSKNLYRDVFIGVAFMTGVFGFMSGEFIISTMLFALASLTSNLDLEHRFKA
jgi:exosortase/archaeosortase